MCQIHKYKNTNTRTQIQILIWYVPYTQIQIFICCRPHTRRHSSKPRPSHSSIFIIILPIHLHFSSHRSLMIRSVIKDKCDDSICFCQLQEEHFTFYIFFTQPQTTLSQQTLWIIDIALKTNWALKQPLCNLCFKALWRDMIVRATKCYATFLS